jgi:hypothetical protein
MKCYPIIFLISVISLTTSYPACAQEIRIDISNIITTILSPPHRMTEITAHADIEKERLRQQADVEKAKIAAEATRNIDRVSPILARWGVNRVACTPGSVFINGLSIDTVCINPINAVTAGYYNYSPEQNPSIRLELKNILPSSPASTPVFGQTIRANGDLLTPGG